MPEFKSEDIKANAVWAAVSYAWILSVVVWLAKKDSPFVQAHARQGVVLLAATAVFSFVPVLSGGLDLIVGLVALTAMIIAARGGFWKIPLVAELADRLPF